MMMDYVDLSELEKMLFLTMHLRHKRIHMLMENSGLHPKQPMVLYMVNNNFGLNQRELAKMLRVRAASVTVILQRLEKSGMITRLQDEQDQRITRVYITDKGKKELEAGMEGLKVLEKETFANISEEDKNKFAQILKVINKNLMQACQEEGDEELNFMQRHRRDHHRC